MEVVAGLLAVMFWVIILAYVAIGLVSGLRRYARKHGVSCFDNDKEGVPSVLFWGALWPLIFFSESYRDPQLCTHPEHVFRRQEMRHESERYHEALRSEREAGF